MNNNDKKIIGLILIGLIIAIIFQNYSVYSITKNVEDSVFVEPAFVEIDTNDKAPCSPDDASCVLNDFPSSEPGEFLSS